MKLKYGSLCRFFSFFCITSSLTGCFLVNGPLNTVKQNEGPDLGYLPIGIPFILGGHGTSVPITKELSITAKHVAIVSYNKVLAYHPDCDVAIIEEDNEGKEIVPLGTVNSQDLIFTYGKGMTGNNLVGEGKYFTDVRFTDSDLFKKCPASITDAPIQSGMSGGGAFNEKGQLVGIISGISGNDFRLLDGTKLGNERTSIFVPLFYTKKWIVDNVALFYKNSSQPSKIKMSMAFQQKKSGEHPLFKD